MKFIRFATIAALSTTILAGGATAAFAEEARKLTTDGQIEFRPSGEEDGPAEVIPPETDPGVEIEPEIPGTTGPLSIMKAAHMDFGTQVISNQLKHYNMVAEMQQRRGTTGDENKVPYVSFVQVLDERGSNDGWDVQVSLSDFVSNSQNDVLTGAEIEFVGGWIRYEGINQENAPSAHADGLVISPTTGARSVMTAEAGKGALTSSVVWGNQADLDAQFADEDVEVVENDAIRLTIPGSTAKDATTYTSVLTWELTSTPGADGTEPEPEA